jgi:xyloglucan-specific exo-beta-1,4-glucanase
LFSDGGAFGPTGTFFVAVNSVGVLRYKTGTVTNVLSTASANIKVAVHPTVAGQVAILIPGTGLYFSDDDCDTFENGSFNFITETTWSCPEVPWLEELMLVNAFGSGTVRQIAWNPAVTNELWACFSQGIVKGIFDGVNNPAFEGKVLGIEELVGNQIMAPPGASHILTCNWDEGGFIKTKTAEGLATPPSAKNGPPSITGAYSALYNIWMFASDPQDTDLIVCSGNQRFNTTTYAGNGYSTDAGVTWSNFASPPSPALGADQFKQIAINNGIILYHYGNQNDAFPMRSTDLGNSWTQLTSADFSGHSGGNTGFGAGSNVQYISFCADRVDPDVFYGVSISATAGKRGLWKSTDGGASWTNVNDTLGNTITSTRQLWAVPNNEGHVFLIPAGSNSFYEGLKAPSAASELGSGVYRTTDGGTTLSLWDTDIRMVDGFGFGKEATPGGYPTIFFSGIYKGRYGIYRIINNDVSTIRQYWSTDFKAWPLGHGTGNWIIQQLTGDPDIFGRVYIAFGNRGFCYADLA